MQRFINTIVLVGSLSSVVSCTIDPHFLEWQHMPGVTGCDWQTTKKSDRGIVTYLCSESAPNPSATLDFTPPVYSLFNSEFNKNQFLKGFRKSKERSLKIKQAVNWQIDVLEMEEQGDSKVIWLKGSYENSDGNVVHFVEQHEYTKKRNRIISLQGRQAIDMAIFRSFEQNIARAQEKS